LTSTGRARHLVAAGAQSVVWSEPVDRRRHGLVLWRGGQAAPLPVASSQRPLVARAGRWRGHPVVSYVRCRRGRCRPFAWDLVDARERRLHLRVPRGCVVRDMQLWGRRRAYVVARKARCPGAAQGLWTQWRSRPARLVSRTGRLGALRGDRLAFTDRTRRGQTWRIRLARAGRPVKTLARSSSFFAALFGRTVTLDGRYIYWSVASEDLQRLILVRRRVHGRSRCAEMWPRPRGEIVGIDGRTESAFDEPSPDFSVRRSRIFYINDAGVFKADPTRVRFRRSCAAAVPGPPPLPPPGPPPLPPPGPLPTPSPTPSPPQ